MPIDDTENIGREETEARLQAARESLSQVESALLATIHEFIDKKPSLFMRVVCEAILGIHNEEFPNPFLEVCDQESLVGVRKNYSDLATLVLYQLDESRVAATSNEYISLESWIKNNAGKPHCPPKWKFKTTRLNSTAWNLVLGLEGYFGIALNYAYELIYHGIPIYVFDESRAAYDMVSFANDDYAFMYQLGKHRMDIRTGSYPEWIKGYSVKASDIAAHDIFFRGELPERDGIDLLRYAFRRNLHPSLVEDQTNSETAVEQGIRSVTFDRLLRAVADFPTRYPDYRTRQPKLDDDVRVWLKDQRIAENDAEKRVFGRILSEHFKLSPDTQQTQ